MSVDFQIKGWCPGALRPMESGDGLVVRLRLPLGRMTPDQARGIARAAITHGNGQLELSNRANLQLRGVRDESHGPLLADLARLGVLDSDLALELRRNILLSPFWVDGDGSTDLATGLQEALGDLPDLPGKFGHIIDIGPQRDLAEASGDLRIERGVSGGLILRADGAELGQPVTPDTAMPALIALAQWFVDRGGISGGRGRMRGLVARGLVPPMASEAPVDARPVPGPGPTATGTLAAFEFGAISADTLTALADLGRALRLTPWRMILIEGPSPDILPVGLITNPAHPMLSLRACPGAPFCPQAHAPTRDLARGLAGRVPRGKIVHVSGCAKGCAHPQASNLTLVATPQGFISGQSCAAPDVSGLARSAADLLADPRLFAQPGAV